MSKGNGIMDLDNIKSKWNQIDITSSVSEDEIKQILKKKGKTGLNKLIRLEIIFLVTSVLLIGAPFLHNYFFTEQLGYTKSLKILFISYCIFFIVWQNIKLRHLLKINIDKNNLMTCSSQVLRYRRYLTFEIFLGFILLITFMFAFGINILSVVPEHAKIYFGIYIAIITLIGALIVLLFYKKTYSKQIKKIREALKEIEEFEKEN
jgi:hypothetical protein